MQSKMGLRIDDQMEAVLDAISEHGYATTGMLLDRAGMTRPTLAKRLDRLHAAEAIEYVHEPTAFWKLVDDPREEAD